MAHWKKKQRKNRKIFKKELYKTFQNDLSFAYAIYSTTIANRHRKYIHRLHYNVSRAGEESRNAIRKEIGGMLCGDDLVINAIQLCHPELYKYAIAVSPQLLMGDAYGLALRRLNQQSKILIEKMEESEEK